MGTGADVAGEQRAPSEPLDDPGQRQPPDDNGLGAVMSPFDEQQEWAKISEIMASFGSGIVRESVFVTEFEKEFQTRLGLNSDTGSPCVTLVGQWLAKLNLADYESLFVNYGYDDLEFINGVLEESDLRDMGIGSEEEVRCIMEAASLLANRVEKRPAAASQSVDEWLKAIHLQGYAELFRRHLYTDMERVRRVWEVELAAVLEIQKPGHRKRILASVTGGTTNLPPPPPPPPTTNGNPPANLVHLNKDLNTLKNNIKQLKEEMREKLPETTGQNNGVTTPTSTGAPTATGTTTGTLKHRKNRPAPPPPQRPANAATHNGSTSAQPAEPLEIRAPNELLFGVPSTLKTQWRHQPKDLVTGCVTYVANYLGSTVVKELQGMESTKKSIHKLKKINRDPRGSPDISLAISYRGVRFLNALTDEPICEHEIRNIHCACQDADDLTHFAYITKDHASRTHFCHVFCVPTMDQATEIILTLGQAFEVAYQIALRDKLGGGQPVRSQSAGQMAPNYCGATRASNSAKHSEQQQQQQQQQNNNEPSSANGRSKCRSKSITNPFTSSSSSPNKGSANCHPSNSTSNNPSPRSAGGGSTVRMLASHGRSHSEHDIKINGNNQLKLAPAPVDDIGIGVKDMKPGSRAPIALSEEL